VAAPLAAHAVLSGSQVLADEPAAIVTAPTGARADVDLEREVESLLKLVDPQVVYRRKPVPPEKNGWPIWKKAYESYVKQPEDEEFIDMISRVLDGGEFPTGELKNRLLDWIDKNAECRRLMDEGIKLGALELPRAEKSGSLSLALDEIHLFRTLSQLRYFTSLVAAENEQFDQAAKEAFTGLEFAAILLASECMLVDFLVGVAILSIAVHAVHRFSVADGVPVALARESIQRLDANRVGTGALKRAYGVEYCRWILPFIARFPTNGTTEELVKHYLFGLSEPAFDYKPSEKVQAENDRAARDITFLLEGHDNPFDKEATAKLGSDFYVRLFAEMEKLVRDRDFVFAELRAQVAAWPEEVEPDLWLVANLGPRDDEPKELTKKELVAARDRLRMVDNPLGKRVVTQFISGTGHHIVEEKDVSTTSAILRIAMRLYERKHGGVPDTLATLVTDGLISQVPKDAFDGKEFKYSKEQRVIWSVGPEGTNDGEIREPDQPDQKFDEEINMTWRI
jgi:hypothetical protein